MSVGEDLGLLRWRGLWLQPYRGREREGGAREGERGGEGEREGGKMGGERGRER